jgi:hypothetical protein
MKKLIFTMILTIAFISVPYVDSAHNKTDVQTGVNKAADMMAIKDVKNISLMPAQAEKVKAFETRKKVLGLNEKISAYRIPAGKKDKLFGLLLLAYGGNR